jgi:hypothetical protein
MSDLGPVDAAVIACWKANYGLERTPPSRSSSWITRARRSPSGSTAGRRGW